jgi:hypothetical protein
MNYVRMEHRGKSPNEFARAEYQAEFECETRGFNREN